LCNYYNYYKQDMFMQNLHLCGCDNGIITDQERETKLSHLFILIENCKIYAFLYICLVKLQLS